MLDVFQLMLVSGAWDPGSVLDSAVDWLKDNGAKFLTVLGTIAVIWGGIYLFRVVIGSQQKGKMFVWALVSFIVGGILAVGGLTFLLTVAEGGYDGAKGVGGIILPTSMTSLLQTMK